MDLYTSVSQQLAKQLTTRYSSSFSASSLLFSKQIRNHIYAIYGLVRIADEIVDTYQGDNQLQLLDDLEADTYRAMQCGYSVNPIVHAFAVTATTYNIEPALIKPFFDSMRSDISPPIAFSQSQYEHYIYGSAEVVGLMCLRVFTLGDSTLYEQLQTGAQKLGSAYQKANFLRDFASDYHDLHRVYFPGVSFETFNEDDKQAIVDDIKADFAVAKPTIVKLPKGAQKAVRASYDVYYELLIKLEQTPAASIKQSRVRVPNWRKSVLILDSLRKGNGA